MWGHPFFLSSAVCSLLLRLLRLRVEQKSLNTEGGGGKETLLTHWWHYLHRRSLQISLSLTNTSTAQFKHLHAQ